MKVEKTPRRSVTKSKWNPPSLLIIFVERKKENREAAISTTPTANKAIGSGV